MSHIYGAGYEDAAAREDARLEAQHEAWAEQMEHDMSMMAADRETNRSPLDAEYPPDDATVWESRTVATDDTLDPETTMSRFAYDLDHGATLHDAQNEAWLDTKEPANLRIEYPPEQCDRCGEPMKHGGNDGHQCS